MTAELADKKRMLERIMRAAGAKNASALAEILGVSAQAVYDAKRRDKVPDAWVRIIAEAYSVSADWLFFGRGAVSPTTPPKDERLSASVVFNVVETLEVYFQGTGTELPPTIKAGLVCRAATECEAQGNELRLGQLLQIIQNAAADARPPCSETD